MNFNDLIERKKEIMTGTKNRFDKDYKGYENFLQSARTVPCLDRDFIEWHNGIPHYGFWAVVIDDPNWIELWKAARVHIKRFVYPDYQRAPHITIGACGLLDQNHFSNEQFKQQWRALSEIMIPPFYLTVSSLNSFTTAPCLMIEDSTGALKQIRDCLAMISKEDEPVQYQPHITLGLYRDAFCTVEVASCLARFKFTSIKPMLVTKLAFCVYETINIQGQFRIIKQVRLNAEQKLRSGNEKKEISLQGMRSGGE
jgi:2'-5' RNA ligase